MNKVQISAVIITYNEEKNIERCLLSLQNLVDEIVVLDSFSDDETENICKKYNVNFFQHSFDNHINKKNRAITYASHPYVLSLDADEALSDDLKASILFVKKNWTHDGYYFNRLNNYCGKWIKHCGWYPDRKLRLWDSRKGKWGGVNPHDKYILEENATQKHIKGDLLHYTYHNSDEHLLQNKKIAILTAIEKEKKGKNTGLIKAIINTKWKFFKSFFIKAGFLDGKNGFRISCIGSLGYMIRYSTWMRIKLRDKKVKNVCFANTTKFWGGGEKWHHDTALYLKNKNYQSFGIVAKGSRLFNQFKKNDITVFTCRNRALSFLNPFKIFLLIRFFRKNKIQHLIINGSADLKTVGIAAWLAGVPDIIYRRGIAKKPSANVFNSCLFTVIVDRFLSNSKETIHQLFDGIKIPLNKFKYKVLYNGIDVSKITNHFQNSKKSKAFIIGNVARLTKQKGHHHLLNIAKYLKEKNIDFLIKIAGSGEEEENIKNIIEKEGLSEQIELLGFVDDIQEFISEIDILVSTAAYEGFGYVLAEAMNANKAVLAFNISSNPEIIEDKKSGILIEAFDIKAFGDSIIDVYHDEGLRKRLGEAGRQRVEKNFNKDIQLSLLEDYIFNS